MEVFHRTFHILGTNEKVPTALVKREDERKRIFTKCLKGIYFHKGSSSQFFGKPIAYKPTSGYSLNNRFKRAIKEDEGFIVRNKY